MPGSSLWLLPPSTHPLSTILPTLIDKTSTHFSSPHRFIPHVTLTSEIDPSTYSPNPQQWLDSLPFPSASSATVKFGRLRSEDVFVRKLYIGVEKAGVKQIGKVTRQRVKGFEGEVEAERWAKEKYGPHLSLLYHDCPKVQQDEIDKIKGLVEGAGVDLKGEGELGGWVGGRVVLVPTDRPIGEWEPIAERELS